MNTISKRLNEPAGPTWRQTYKGLQLLEFLIINGSEQVIDDAKRRIYEIKGCETYQYMDDKRKDQGINSTLPGAYRSTSPSNKDHRAAR
ncbi:Epsin-3, clathrin recruitment and traffic between the Golgi and endosome [Kappamyces sp. JEL0680]|nr:Epsin-3, clathrin recruitment and traffic between the Golgi and endosome [Kappamyces sp. JEL0680]